MEENKKLNKQIVIMVILVIILILSLLGILVYEVYKDKNNKVIKNNNSTSTTSSTTSTSSTEVRVENKELVASNVLVEYLENLKSENKIRNYNIIDSKILEEDEVCPNYEYDNDKIYYSINVEYERIDEDFVLTGNDDNTSTDNEKIYRSGAIYIISDNKILDLYTEC